MTSYNLVLVSIERLPRSDWPAGIWEKRYCVGLNKNGPHRLIYLTYGHQEVTLIEKIRICGLAEGNMSLEIGFEISRAQARPNVSLYSVTCRS